MIHLVSVAFGGDETLERTLPTWTRALAGTDWQITVWDNSPAAETTGGLIRRLMPNATVLSDGTNRGFAGGVNRLVDKLPAGAGDVLILLNLDVSMTAEWVAEVSEFAERRVLGAVPLVTDGRAHCGIAVDRVLNFRDAALGADIVGPSGGGAVIPLEVFHAVGPFNEAYFAWGEDAEWAMRASRLGFETQALTVALAHEGRHTITDRARRNHRAFLLARNRVWFWKAFAPRLLRRIALLAPWIGSAVVIAARGINDRTVRARVGGLLAGIRQ